MTEETKCDVCGEPMPADAPAGACARCLLAEGLSDGSPDAEELAEHFPGLDLLGLVGRGGMGIVYRARQKTLDRIVALKILPPETSDGPGFSDRFLREARAMAKLGHPNIVSVHDFGETEGLYWLLMEYVEGVNLRQLMAEGIEPKQALRIVPQVCDALQYAHDRGIVHRDVKPENILVDRQGNVKITDFGLAKLLDHEPTDLSLTGTGQVMGTLHYMAPEQYRTPGDVDHRADIYSLGVVFYEMLTGQLPVGKFDPPSKRVEVDVRLDGVVLRALESERERRYQRAEEVGTEVDTISRSDAPAAAPAAVAAEPEPPEREEPAKLSRLAVLGALLLPGTVLVLVVGGFLAAVVAPVGVNVAGIVMVAIAGLGLSAVAGFVISIVALARISGSRGRLTGSGFAATGVILPGALLLILLFVVPFLYLGTRVSETEPEPGPSAPEVREPGPLPGPPRMGVLPEDKNPDRDRDAILRLVLDPPPSQFDDARERRLFEELLAEKPAVEVTVEGDRAVVAVRGESRVMTLRYRKQDGRWRPEE